MSPFLRLTRFLLIALVAVSLGAWAKRAFLPTQGTSLDAPLPSDGTVVINFHSATRCSSCLKIGAQTRAVVEEDFRMDLESGRLHWRVLDFEAPANRLYATRYNLTTSTVVVTQRRGGKDVEWRRLDGVWEHVFEEASMRSYLREGIGAMIPNPTQLP